MEENKDNETNSQNPDLPAYALGLAGVQFTIYILLVLSSLLAADPTDGAGWWLGCCMLSMMYWGISLESVREIAVIHRKIKMRDASTREPGAFYGAGAGIAACLVVILCAALARFSGDDFTIMGLLLIVAAAGYLLIPVVLYRWLLRDSLKQAGPGSPGQSKTTDV